MFIKHNNKIYKEVVLEELSKEELLEVAKWVEEVKEKVVYVDKIIYKDKPFNQPYIYPRDNPNKILYSVQ